MQKCKGLVTRKRVTKNGIEESTIDFVLMSEDLANEVESIEIEKERNHVLTKITKTKKGVKKVESDHNIIFSKSKMSWSKKVKGKRVELFNLKNKKCQDIFKEATKGVNNDNYLSAVFDDEEDINISTNKFLKRLQKTINKCFKKVRITNKVDDVKEELFEKWKELRKKFDENSNEELERVENYLAENMPESSLIK